MNRPWYKEALIGVGATPALPLDGELGRLMNELTENTEEPALAYSRMMAVVAAAHRAAVALPDPLAPLPTPAGPDATVLPSTHAWVGPLAYCLDNGPLRLQYEACEQLRRHKRSLPLALLPAALEAGRQAVELRQYLLPVLGERGRWLARLNSRWAYAAGPGDIRDGSDQAHPCWTSGAFSERLGYLQRLRSQNAALARVLLQTTLEELPAKERLAFVETFAVGLEPDDEVLLSQRLSDRSREVRRAASILLARLPDSNHAKRLNAWLSVLITPKRGLLGGSWRCNAPTQANEEWAKAGINPKRPAHESLGERAWWLYQLVRSVPLPWWERHTDMSPEQLLAWARKSDWKEALLRGWNECAGVGDDAWIAAMVASKQPLFKKQMARLLSLLEPAKRERYWPKTLAELQVANLLHDVIESCAPGDTLSAAFSRGLVAGLAQAMSGDGFRQNHLLRQLLAGLVCVVHPESLQTWRSPPREGDETSAQAEALSEIGQIIEARKTLHSNPV